MHKVCEGLYKVSLSTEFNYKETGFVLSTILKKSGKTVKMVQFFWTFLTVKSHFFKNGSLKWVLFFCVAISASRRFIWAIKQHLLMIFNFHISKGGPFWFRGGPSTTPRGWTGQKQFLKFFSWTLWYSPCIKISGQKISQFFIFSNHHIGLTMENIHFNEHHFRV